MESTQGSLDQLYQLVVERERLVKEATNKISSLIAPGVLAGIADVLSTPVDKLEVVSIDMFSDELQTREKTTIMITAQLSYPSIEEVPELLNEISPLEFEDQDPLRRLVRVAIPFSYAFETKEFISNMLTNMLLEGLEAQNEEDALNEIELFNDVIDKKLESNVVSLADYNPRINKDKLH